MTELGQLASFLDTTRKRALYERSIRINGYALTGLVGLLLVLAVGAYVLGPAGFWPYVTGCAILLTLVVGGTLGYFWPAHLWRSPSSLARLIGKKHAPLRGDLLAAIELSSPSALAQGSPSLVEAFRADVAARALPLDPEQVFPLKDAIRAVYLAAGSLLVLLCGLLFLPNSLGRGLRLLFHTPTLFEGAQVSRDPLVGDLRVTYDYPAYTNLPRQTIEGSTGDLHALRGTRVRLEMRPLHSAHRAVLLLGDSGEEGQIQTTFEQGRFVTSFDLVEDQSYRVWLRPYLGRSVREDRMHRIDVDPDRTPEVDVVAPADQLELAHPRPIELAYHARDDFGLGEVAIVYQVGNGPTQRILLKDAQGTKEVRGTTNFEPATTLLLPGVKVAYRVEARDRDDVSGSKVGTSRTLSVVVQNPREALEDRLGLEREILDKLLAALGTRLEMEAQGQSIAAEVEAAREGEESALLYLGRLIEDMRRTGGAQKALAARLAGHAEKLSKWVKEEGSGMRPGSKGAGKRNPVARHVAELEATILVLDDLMGRQNLDDLAGMGKELVNAHTRLQELLERFKATGDESLRRQIERDVRELRDRISELIRKIAEVKSRNEVNTEWLNLPDTQQALKKAAEMDNLLEKGDARSLDRVLAELGASLHSMRDLLEQNAQGFHAARFPQELRALSEVSRKLSDLEGDERNLADDTSSLAREIDGEIGRKMAGKQGESIARAKSKLEAIASRMAGNPPREVGGASESAAALVRENIRQLRRLLPAKEWNMAVREAERMVIGMAQIQASVNRSLAPERPFSQAVSDYDSKLKEAFPLARELMAELAGMLPNQQNATTAEQRGRSQKLGERQGNIAGRANEILRDLASHGEAMPHSEKIRSGLEEITQQMRQAGNDLQQGAAREASGRTDEIANRLAKLRQDMAERPSAQNRQNREPVHIPGAESSRAPRAWREELLEAMREKAVDGFRDEVRKYYEDLVK